MTNLQTLLGDFTFENLPPAWTRATSPPLRRLRASLETGAAAMVRLERHFEPDAQQHRLYAAWFVRYRPLVREYLRGLVAPVE